MKECWDNITCCVILMQKQLFYKRFCTYKITFSNMAKRVKAPFCGDHDHSRMVVVQLPPLSHMLLRSWIRCFTMIISA